MTQSVSPMGDVSHRATTIFSKKFRKPASLPEQGASDAPRHTKGQEAFVALFFEAVSTKEKKNKEKDDTVKSED